MGKPNLRKKEKEWKRIEKQLKEKMRKKALNDGEGMGKDRGKSLVLGHSEDTPGIKKQI